ncbi:hypothetical protein HYD68_00845 [Mycoplasmopsis bovis]|nr:hypothetical protein [Mycoplasmopsis bovis]QQH54567.1 hypothetical protein HYD68_00845 [Mycoplasmopsis bovis]
MLSLRNIGIFKDISGWILMLKKELRLLKSFKELTNYAKHEQMTCLVKDISLMNAFKDEVMKSLYWNIEMTY